MNIKQLEYFLKAVECGSLTKASQQLFVSQPSLTKSIASLEKEFGTQLLLRSSSGIELTKDGKRFLYYAKSVLSVTQTLEQNFNNSKPVQHSQLFLASQQLDFIYDILLKVYEDNWDKKLHYVLVETDRNDVTRKVLDGDVNLGLVVRNGGDGKSFLWATREKHLDIQMIDKDDVFACVGPNSPYYMRSSITFSEAMQSPGIVLDTEKSGRQSLFFDNTNSFFNQNKIVFFNSIAACEHFLLETDSLLYIAKWAAGCFKDRRIHTLKIEMEDEGKPFPPNELLLIKRKGSPLNATEECFCNQIAQLFSLDASAFFK